jgi:hypothetical protein
MPILGAFAKLRKGNISFAMSICPSARKKKNLFPNEHFIMLLDI